MSPKLNPGWAAVGSLVELAFSERDCLVWSLFSLYRKNEWLFLPLSLNKGGPFGFHNSDRSSESFLERPLGKQGTETSSVVTEGPRAWFGGHAHPLPPLQSLPMPVCCAVYGAIIHSEDSGVLLLCSLGGHFTLLFPGRAWIEKGNGDQEPGVAYSVAVHNQGKN